MMKQGKDIKQIDPLKLNNWLHERLPMMEDITSQCFLLMLCIVNRINRNFWRPTQISNELLLKDTKMCKRILLNSRKILEKRGLINVIPGKNAIQMATFSLGSLVTNETSVQKGLVTNETSKNGAAVTNETVTGNSGNRSLVTNETQLKTSLNGKHLSKTDFEIFYELYGKNKKKEEAKQEWIKLTDEQRKKAIEVIPAYKRQTPDLKYRKDPANFLKEKKFNDVSVNSDPGTANPQKVALTRREKFEKEVSSLMAMYLEGKLEKENIDPECYDRLTREDEIPSGVLHTLPGETSDEKKVNGVIKYLKEQSQRVLISLQ